MVEGAYRVARAPLLRGVLRYATGSARSRCYVVLQSATRYGSRSHDDAQAKICLGSDRANDRLVGKLCPSAIELKPRRGHTSKAQLAINDATEVAGRFYRPCRGRRGPRSVGINARQASIIADKRISR
jgi:hypothetical protein